ncbi:conserved protein of unknown function [Tenacibaculum sp. 190524A02b]|uniref:hypothetical protein n=1 Tax=Tenacibaculum vairaonense TaxID=3137860 RepID=UPI0032B19A90
MAINKDLIYSKLECNVLRYNYLINDVSVGLNLALKSKAVRSIPELQGKLKIHYDEVMKLRVPVFRDVVIEDQIKARDIGLEAIDLIEQYL